ncbi:hypothetical protein ERX46_02255 [Brumimicrobium glaciale]|jgi:tetratricopeptide (TPR) repeat protein|uniref:Tetratricopeptide repeat protein n=1 Tax=Brumimicrobium glaciale TaxID=200475 RepID=A0A4Q4KT00_9FLAO|nr:hypothetical protein [Brumimicrobium glaciale]RYM35839.1 hypothetical protein ERX46_02255 [Brumimicrobium glaciale]
MKKIIYVFSVLIVFASCNSNNEEVKEEKEEMTVESMKASIKEMDDSLKVMMDEAIKSPEYKMNRVAYHEAINRNKDFYQTFPNDPYAEKALGKIAGIYLQLNIEEEAVKWRDTLLNNYPNTEDKIGLLELQMNYYDYNMNNKEKIKHYANRLLAIENLSEEKREQYEFRLEHIDKSFEELIELQIIGDMEKVKTEHPQ